METERQEVETEVDRGLIAFLETLAFFVLVILGFANMLANNIT